MAVVILIHGTGADAKANQGDEWWQRGSPFERSVAGRLAQMGCFLQKQGVFHWSGANSEQERRNAAIDLLDNWLLPNENNGEPYHLVGHSHGGSIVWASL